VIAQVGVFFVIAAVRFSPSKAEGIDRALRASAHPGGDVAAHPVARGLIAFGLFPGAKPAGDVSG
jgi:hypothetical protein